MLVTKIPIDLQNIQVSIVIQMQQKTIKKVSIHSIKLVQKVIILFRKNHLISDNLHRKKRKIIKIIIQHQNLNLMIKIGKIQIKN